MTNETEQSEEPVDTMTNESSIDFEPDEITEEEMQQALEKLLPRYEQMLQNLAQ